MENLNSTLELKMYLANLKYIKRNKTIKKKQTLLHREKEIQKREKLQDMGKFIRVSEGKKIRMEQMQYFKG